MTNFSGFEEFAIGEERYDRSNGEAEPIPLGGSGVRPDNIRVHGTPVVSTSAAFARGAKGHPVLANEGDRGVRGIQEASEPVRKLITWCQFMDVDHDVYKLCRRASIS
ncbi:MAG: hypothetical protein U0132_02125 [Gemmatimonadaceae bacterium]